MVKPWMFKGPALYCAVALISYPFFRDYWHSMHWSALLVVAVVGPLLAVPMYMPSEPVQPRD